MTDPREEALLAAVKAGLRIANTLSCDVPLSPGVHAELTAALEAFDELERRASPTPSLAVGEQANPIIAERQNEVVALANRWEGGSGELILPITLHEVRAAAMAICALRLLPLQSAPPKLSPEPTVAMVEDLRARMRMIVSHATGGAGVDIDSPINTICVRITQRVNRVWEAAQEAALAAAQPATRAQTVEEKESNT